MNTVKTLLAASGLALGLLTTSQAGAVAISIEEPDGQDVGNHSGGGIIQYDITFTTGKPVVVDVLVQESDGDQVTLAGSYGNETGSAWSGLDVTLDGGATWQETSSIFPGEDIAAIIVSPDRTIVETAFATEVESPGSIEFGNTQVEAEQEWVINIKDVTPGSQFQITVQPFAVTVPEPGMIALLSLGLVGMGLARRK